MNDKISRKVYVISPKNRYSDKKSPSHTYSRQFSLDPRKTRGQEMDSLNNPVIKGFIYRQPGMSNNIILIR